MRVQISRKGSGESGVGEGCAFVKQTKFYIRKSPSLSHPSILPPG